MKARFLLMLCLVAVFTVAINAADETMVLYLSFDEVDGENVIDLSNSGNDAKLNGEAKIGSGKFGSGAEMGTDAWLVVADNDNLDLTSAMTISMWAKIETTGDTQSGAEKQPGWGAGEYNLALEYGGGVLFQAADLPDECDDEASAGPSLVDQGWHYATGTWDGSVIRIYVDGEMRNELPCAGEIAAGDGDLFIGCRGGTARWVNGFIDEIKIYNRALSQAEIKLDMTNPRHNSAAVSPLDKMAITWGSIKNN